MRWLAASLAVTLAGCYRDLAALECDAPSPARHYGLVDGSVVADDWHAMLTEPLQHPIELTELGEVLHVGVWTGTRHGDGRAVPGSMHCDDWTSDDPDKQASFGISDEVDINWTQSQYVNPHTCGSMFAIYCIEQQ